MAKPLLSLKDVHVRRGMSVVLDSCSVDVDSGQTVVLTGANGAGKSTLLEAAVGLLPLEQGRVHHDATVIIDAEGRRRTSPLTVGTVLQKNGMLGSEVVIEHLQCAMGMSGSTVDAEPFLEAFNLAHRANDMVAHLSQGQARKVAVLAGLLPAFASSTPALVLLDEPDAGLDEASMDVLCGWLDQLRGHGHAILLATHDQRLVERATHTMDVAEGTMMPTHSPSEAAPHDLQRQPTKPTRRAAWGVNMHLRTMMWLNTNGMAGLLSLGVLLALGSFMDGLDEMQQLGFVLAPTMAVGLCGEPLVSALRADSSVVASRERRRTSCRLASLCPRLGHDLDVRHRPSGRPFPADPVRGLCPVRCCLARRGLDAALNATSRTTPSGVCWLAHTGADPSLFLVAQCSFVSRTPTSRRTCRHPNP